MRRYIYIAIAVVIVIVAVVLYLLFRGFSGPGGTTTTGTSGFLPTVGTGGAAGGTAGTGSAGSATGGTAAGGGLPNVNSPLSGAAQALVGNFGVAFGEPTLDYFVNASNTILVVEPDGKIAQVLAGGQSTYLSSSEIANVAFAAFSYDGKKALVEFGSPSNPQWSVFDIATKAWTPLSINPSEAAWSPNNYQIAYFGIVNGASALQTLDVGNPKAKPKTYMPFTSEDFTLLWPTANTILLSDRSSAYFSGSIFSLNLKTATLSPVVEGRVGLQVKWNASGTMGLVLAGTNLGRGGQLGIIDGSGNFLHLMTFLTLPSKCGFADIPAAGTAAATSTATSTAPATTPELLCGIPRSTSLLQGNPLPDAYDEKLFSTVDGLYSVSLADGSVSSLWNDPSQNMDVSNVKFFNNTVFFTNRYDQKLYALSLAAGD